MVSLHIKNRASHAHTKRKDFPVRGAFQRRTRSPQTPTFHNPVNTYMLFSAVSAVITAVTPPYYNPHVLVPRWGWISWLLIIRAEYDWKLTICACHKGNLLNHICFKQPGDIFYGEINFWGIVCLLYWQICVNHIGKVCLESECQCCRRKNCKLKHCKGIH